MKKFILTAFVYLFCISLVQASPVDEETARKSATNFLRSTIPATRSANLSLTRAITGVADGDDAGIYVFNSADAYVVISADDELPAVLAFGDGKPYYAATAPAAMKAMLEAYSNVAKTTAKTRGLVDTHADIEPLVKTQWNQSEPYNLQCPKDKEGVHYPTGCVATAMAQIMYYHKCPSTYDWDKMTTTYKSTDTGTAANAVAKLMADCGNSVFMEYASDGSSARTLDACEALRNDYGYAETTDFVLRTAYTAKSWDELIYAELAAKRPVLYGGNSCSSGQGIAGHAFVIDGYKLKDGTGYYHVNWGWGGYSDGYFLISVLDPEYEYTGGNAGSSGYSLDQEAIIGIQPATTALENATRYTLRDVYVVGDKSSFNRTSSGNFTGFAINFSFYNLAMPEATRSYDYRVALYKDRELVKVLEEYTFMDSKGDKNFEYGYGLKGMQTNLLTFGKGLDDGKYQIRFLSRESGKTEWHWAMNSIFMYTEVTISGNTLTTENFGRYAIKSPEPDFTINSVDVSGAKKVGEPITFTINLTDKNNYGNAPIFLWGNASIAEGSNKFQLLTGGGTNLDPGETGTVVLKYTPQRAGNFTFYLSSSSDKLNKQGDAIEVSSISGMALHMDLEVDGAKSTSYGWNDAATGTTLSGKAYITNYGSEVYDDQINIELYGGTSANGLNRVDVQKPYKPIAVGETVEFSFSFDNLTVGNYYLPLFMGWNGNDPFPLNFELFEKDGKSYFSYKYSAIYHLVEGTAIQSIKQDVPADADVYDMRGVRVGKASQLKSLPKGIYIINKQKVINN
ncbi:C10 family peptidase [Xylanibacter ruminicola]|uniref:Spi protease inhibitor n=1 Tax=Xylanibacter ruminicola TaxID=839 RepID=A0A1M6XEB6_XYLRU|nr:C10 family peptidase [Xylanibacter ruminicola]SHL04155.1 Spi protease inhibitor [Xylanibacter ruminicola]